MPLDWSTDRRQLLKAGGVIAGLAAAPRFAFAADGDTLKIRVDSDLQVLDPAFMIGNLDEVMMRCIYVSLTRLGDISAFGKWSLYGAETLDINSPTEIHFTLIPGLKWTGGFGAVTAEDVKFSFERIANPATASPWAFQFEKLDKVEVIDERKGVIRLKSAYQPFFVASIPYYGGHIISKAATEKAGGKFTTEPPAQCGAMLIDKWEPQQRILLKANPDWPGPKSAFDKIEIAIVTDDQVALLNYKAGSYDYCRIDPSAVVALKKELPPATTLIEAQSTRYVWLTINQLSTKLADAKVRAALQSAIDVDQVIAGAYDGLVPRSTGVVQPTSVFARKANRIPGADAAKAQALLAEAGVNGLELKLACLSDSRSTAVAQIIQASAEAAGIKLAIEPYESGPYWALGDKTQGDGYKSLELVLMAFAGGVDPSENLVWFRPDQIGVYNWSGFDSKEFEEAYQQLIAEPDEAKRIALSNRMEELMEDSGTFIFLCHEPLTAVHKSNLKPVILPDGHPNPVAFGKA